MSDITLISQTSVKNHFVERKVDHTPPVKLRLRLRNEITSPHVSQSRVQNTRWRILHGPNSPFENDSLHSNEASNAGYTTTGSDNTITSLHTGSCGADKALSERDSASSRGDASGAAGYKFTYASRCNTSTPPETKSTSATTSAEKTKLRRNKSISNWSITIKLGTVEDISTIRTDLASIFIDYNSIAIGLEKYNVDGTEWHAHIYLHIETGVTFDDMHSYLRDVLPDISINIQSTKNVRNWLTYLSKEDKHVYYENIPLSSLHFNYKCYWWAVKAKTFDLTDDFVVDNKQYYKFLEGYFYSVKRLLLSSTASLRNIELVYNGWFTTVAQWWNLKIGSSKHKEKQLYLWGASNCGKSSCIETIIGRENLAFVFEPCVGAFPFHSWHNEVKVVLFEEFYMSKWESHKGLLKRLLEGKSFTIDRKFMTPQTITFTGPVIMVSNELPHFEDAFLNRLNIVLADSVYWTEEKNFLLEKKVDKETLNAVLQETQTIL